MKTLNRYIFFEIVRFSSLCLAVFLGILVTARILKLTSLVINKGISFSEIIVVFLSIIPSFLEIAIPMSVLLGTMLAFARLSLDSEIVVIRASGINLMSLIKPVLAFGILTTLIGFITSLYLKPIGNHMLETKLFSLATQSTTAGLTEGVFNKLGTLTIYSDSITKETGELGRVLIDDRRTPDQQMVISANSGKLISDLETRMLYIDLVDGSIHSVKPDGVYNVTNFVKNTIKIDPQELANQQENTGKKANEMFVPELKDIIFDLKEAGKNPDEKEIKARDSLVSYQLELARKFSMPFACLILSLLAMPLGIHPPRAQNSWGQSLSLMVAMIVFVLYYGLLSVGISLSKDGSLEPSISLWIPNAVFFVITLIALNQMGSEKWTSVIHATSEFLDKLTRKTLQDNGK